jgi:hypothetical protein
LNRPQKTLQPTDSYIALLSHTLAQAKTYSGNVHQQNIHFTFSSIGAKSHQVFVFTAGIPSIEFQSPRSKWVENILQLCNTHNEDAALKEIALHTSRLKVNNEFSKLSTDLLSFEIIKLPDVVLIALLRNTFSVRSHISCWDSLRDQIEQLLERRSRNPRLLLRGLKNYS